MMDKPNMKQRLRGLVLAAVQSWWVIGAIGWAIVVANYPIDAVLPTYAE